MFSSEKLASYKTPDFVIDLIRFSALEDLKSNCHLVQKRP